MSAASQERAVTADGMGIAVRFTRNVSFRLGSQVLSAIVNVGGMVLLGNRLSAAGYGDYVFWYALVPLLASLSDLGTGIIVTRRIAREPEHAARAVGDGLVVKGLVALAALAAMTPAMVALDARHAMLVGLIVVTATFDFSQDAAVWAFRAHERLDLEAVLLLGSQLLWIAGLAIGALSGAGVTFMLGCSAIAFTLRWVVGLAVLSWRFYPPRLAPDRARLRELVAQGLPLALAMFAIVFYGRVGVFLLKAFGNPAGVAQFNVAYMLSQPLGFIASAISMAGFPYLARAALQQDGAVAAALRRGLRYQYMVTLPLTAGLFLLADRILALLFPGGAFQAATWPLRLISLGLAPIFLNLMWRYALAALDRQRRYLAAVLVGLCVNAAVGVTLIPSRGSEGAAIAFVCAELAIAAVCLHGLRRSLGALDQLAAAWKPALATAVMAGVVVVVARAALPVVVAAGLATYAVVLGALRAFSVDELVVFGHLFAPRRARAIAALLPGPEGETPC